MTPRTRQVSTLWGVGLLAVAVAILVGLSAFGWLPLTSNGSFASGAVTASTAPEAPSSTAPASTNLAPQERESPRKNKPDRDEPSTPPVELVGIVPQAVAIPDLGVSAPVVTVGLDAGGGVVVPEDVSILGWYSGSAPVGSEAGSTVIVGHRDSKEQGIGAIGAIETLAAGQRITVAGPDDVGVIYEVEEVAFVEKADFASIVADAFGIDGPHRLTLITCGGGFDAAAGSYLSNVIVTATPVMPGTP